MTEDHWAIMPYLNNPAMTWQSVEDCLAQTLPGVRVLLIGQAPSKADRAEIDARIDRLMQVPSPPYDKDPDYRLVGGAPRVLAWHFLPSLPSLSAVWNRALRFVWELGGTEALVVNNDVRLHRETYEVLSKVRQVYDALFVSAVGVREGQYNPDEVFDPELTGVQKGGPDFSCFLLSREGHERYPFDEGFIPCYMEDLDCHRRYMLGGDGQRIFSVNLPFLHYASGTIKQYSPEARAKFNQQYARNKEYYKSKWGGEVNNERFVSPFGKDEPLGGAACISTPDLQRQCLGGYRRSDGTPLDLGAVPDTHIVDVAEPAAGSAETVPGR